MTDEKLLAEVDKEIKHQLSELANCNDPARVWDEIEWIPLDFNGHIKIIHDSSKLKDGYLIVIDLPEYNAVLESYYSSYYDGLLISLARVFYEDADGLHTDKSRIFGAFSSMEELLEHHHSVIEDVKSS